MSTIIHNFNRKLTNHLHVITMTLLYLNLKYTSSFTIPTTHQQTTHHHPFISHRPPFATTTTTLHLSSPNDSDEPPPPQLITSTSDLESTLENLKSQYPTSEQDYLNLSKRRAAEGRRKLLEEEARERERAAQRERERERGSANPGKDYGPGDLSSFSGFGDDGFEASAGNDDTVASLWSGGGAEEGGEGGGEGEEEPKLLLFDEGGDNPDLLL